MTFNATDPTNKIFNNVKVFDSLKLVTNGCQSKTLQFQSSSLAAKFLMTLQKFLSMFSFFNCKNNEILLNNKHHILKDACRGVIKFATTSKMPC
jgi:hypothetical protein